MKYIIDRFEGKYAIVELEDQTFANVEVSALPPGAKEGDVISVAIDVVETTERKERIQNKMDNLFKK